MRSSLQIVSKKIIYKENIKHESDRNGEIKTRYMTFPLNYKMPDELLLFPYLMHVEEIPNHASSHKKPYILTWNPRDKSS